MFIEHIHDNKRLKSKIAVCVRSLFLIEGISENADGKTTCSLNILLTTQNRSAKLDNACYAKAKNVCA